jgi:hypothetical protein
MSVDGTRYPPVTTACAGVPPAHPGHLDAAPIDPMIVTVTGQTAQHATPPPGAVTVVHVQVRA